MTTSYPFPGVPVAPAFNQQPGFGPWYQSPWSPFNAFGGYGNFPTSQWGNFNAWTPWNNWGFNNAGFNQPSYPVNAWYPTPLGFNPWNSFGFPAFNAGYQAAFPWATAQWPSQNFQSPTPYSAGYPIYGTPTGGTPYPFNGTSPNFGAFRATTPGQTREAA